MNRRFLVLCFVYYARAVQGGIPMTANVNRNGSVHYTMGDCLPLALSFIPRLTSNVRILVML